MIKEILRLREKGLGKVKIAKALGISPNTVKGYVRRHDAALAAGQTGPVAAAMVTSPPKYSAPWAPLVDWPGVKAVADQGEALYHHWETSIVTSGAPELSAVPYIAFWREFKRRYPDVPLDYHKIHPPGERAEIDYKGDAPGLGYIDRATGAFVQCRLFGSILCFSQLFYVEATRTEKQEDFLPAIAASFVYFNGVPSTLAHDNTRAAVVRAHRFDPDFNLEFFHFCEFQGTAPVAARPYSPKDKNLIENALGVFWRWARRQIKARTFFSLAELNTFLRDLLVRFNTRIQRKYGMSRQQKFEAGEQTKLLPLPQREYLIGTWKKHKHHPDCHIQIGYNFYSAPYQHRGEEHDVRVSAHFVEIFHRLDRIAVHVAVPGNVRGVYRTDDSHLPPAQLAMKEATPQQVMASAAEIGTATGQIIDNLITKARHPLMYLRRAQGVTRLAKRYSNKALENACDVLVRIGVEMPKIRDIEEIITNEKARLHAEAAALAVVRQANPNLRGQASWSSNVH